MPRKGQDSPAKAFGQYLLLELSGNLPKLAARERSLLLNREACYTASRRRLNECFRSLMGFANDTKATVAEIASKLFLNQLVCLLWHLEAVRRRIGFRNYAGSCSWQIAKESVFASFSFSS